MTARVGRHQGLSREQRDAIFAACYNDPDWPACDPHHAYARALQAFLYADTEAEQWTADAAALAAALPVIERHAETVRHNMGTMNCGPCIGAAFSVLQMLESDLRRLAKEAHQGNARVSFAWYCGRAHRDARRASGGADDGWRPHADCGQAHRDAGLPKPELQDVRAVAVIVRRHWPGRKPASLFVPTGRGAQKTRNAISAGYKAD